MQMQKIKRIIEAFNNNNFKWRKYVSANKTFFEEF